MTHCEGVSDYDRTALLDLLGQAMDAKKQPDRFVHDLWVCDDEGSLLARSQRRSHDLTFSVAPNPTW